MKIKDLFNKLILKIKSYGLEYWVELGFYAGFIIFLSFIPKVGFINIGRVTITLLCVPVIVSAIRRGPLAGGLMGFVYGLVSFLTSTISKYGENFYVPAGFEYIYTNFFVAIIPRVLLGIITATLYTGFKQIIKRVWFSIPLTALVSMILHVVNIVLFAIIFNSKTLIELYGESWFEGMFFARNNLLNILEIFLTVIISTAIIYVFDIFARKKAIENDEKGEKNEN